MTPPRLLAIGGAHVDRRGRTDNPFVPGVSNPGTIAEEIGGAAFNTARAARRFGIEVSMASARGGDAAANAVAAAFASAGITDLSVTYLDRATPSYTAILSNDGELAAALADMRLYDLALDKITLRSAFRAAIGEASAVLVDANVPGAAIGRIAGLAGDKPLYANAISPAKAVRLIPHLPALACLFMNGNEARAITGQMDDVDEIELVGALRALGLKSAVVTRGSRALTGFDADGAFTLQPPRVEAGDVTGAGDALAGATMSGLMQGERLAEAVRRGVAAGCLIVESNSAAADFSRDSFNAMLQRVGVACPLSEETT